ncbi:hypothetical protein GIB67_027469 [Kingdonia uniflora]|uniref:Protein root UVB sensitive 5 n=1 Tax=Kingdonia uniflora TaxID=39325 RepID=A0A7J7MFL1_9MAGN|nr:hypothetical protein GIB67_027469 [Kingdonia uniflora]
MSSSLQFTLPKFSLTTSRKRDFNAQIPSSPQSNIQSEAGDENTENVFHKQSNVVLVERYANGTTKRYVLDGDLRVQTVLEKQESGKNGWQKLNSSNDELSWVPYIVKDFILPTGFPGSVTDDYLEYMLLQFPTNVTAWICHTLVTSSLLKAVGVGSFSGSTAAASAAAIRWVSKDGIGAIGRFFIGGRFGNLFDDDPKQWRMYADFIGSAGSIFDLTTPLYPAYFLPLASLGNLAKAVASGLKDPSFRVIQNHFAISRNLGEVAAKSMCVIRDSEVILVSVSGGSLGSSSSAGWSCSWYNDTRMERSLSSFLSKDTSGVQKSYSTLALTWLSMRILHLWLRYQSLSVLSFNTINLKRGRILAKSHVLYSTVPGYAECNRKENILTWENFLKPRIVFGVSLEEIIGGEKYSAKVKALLKLYAKEKYILAVNQEIDFKVSVSFKVGATSQSVLRSLWQTYWLHEHWGESENMFDKLERSLLQLDERFNNFLHQLQEAGWDVQQLKLKVPKDIFIDEMGIAEFPETKDV